MSANSRITVVDIQHRSFKRALQGYDRTDVDKFLDEIIESLEDEATARAAFEAEIADLKERISHFKAMEDSLQSTLLLAQRTADEVKAAAHKEADLIKQEARLQSEREIGSLGDKVDESRREHQRMLDIAEKAKSEIRSLLLSHLALIDRADGRGWRPALDQPRQHSPLHSSGARPELHRRCQIVPIKRLACRALAGIIDFHIRAAQQQF